MRSFRPLYLLSPICLFRCGVKGRVVDSTFLPGAPNPCEPTRPTSEGRTLKGIRGHPVRAPWRQAILMGGHSAIRQYREAFVGLRNNVRMGDEADDVVHVWHTSPFIRWVCFPGIGGSPLVFFLATAPAWSLLFTLPWLYVSYRCWFRPFVKADRRGLTIGNPFSTRRLAWSEILTFEVTTSDFPRVKVATTSGDEIRIVATAVAKTPSDHVIDEGRTEGIADVLGQLHKRFTARS